MDGKEATVILMINIKRVKAKIDTGAEVDVMPRSVYNQLSDRKLGSTTVMLHGYGGDNIPLLGSAELFCEYKDRSTCTMFYVVETSSRTVLSLKTCQDLQIIKLMNEVKTTKSPGVSWKLERIKDKHGQVLKDEVIQMYPKLFN